MLLNSDNLRLGSGGGQSKVQVPADRCRVVRSHLKGDIMGDVINFPDKEELKNFRLMSAICRKSRDARNQKARKKFFSWFWRNNK